MDLEKDTQTKEASEQPFPTGEKRDACGAKADDVDPDNIIDFDENDAKDPQNWPLRY